nr:penicillin-binding protein 2 [Dysgonomonas sp. 25]
MDLEKRKYVIGGIVLVTVLIYVVQLFYLQIVNNEYKGYAENNAFFNRMVYPARGTISDRNGKLMVFNEPTYDLVYIPKEVAKFDTLDLCRILDIEKTQFDSLIRTIKRKRDYSPYKQQTILTQLGVKESALIQEKSFKFPGFFIQNRTLRQYNYHSAGLLLGYVAEVNQKQLKEDEYYAPGDYAGKSGIELSYEKYMRGEKGTEVLLRDARGRIQGRYNNGNSDTPPVSGHNLTLSIDIELQEYGEKLMKNKLGSIVMIEPSTGEILCLVTSPTYDPSMLLGKEFSENYVKLEQNPLKPLFNRSIQSAYPPGSTFKTTQGLIFLEEGIINPYTYYSCHHGYPPLGGRPKCHGHITPLNLVPALATSCNSYFCYGLTAMLNNDKYGGVGNAFEVWKNHLVDMGFGYRLGVDLPYENRGFIPSTAYYNKHKGVNWKPANVISISIGQGEVLLTPLQGANLAATIANKGYYYTPHVVKEIQDTILDEKYTEKNYTGIKEEYYSIILDGMRRAVTEGTCKGANLGAEIKVYGKTGTAENSHGKDHSLFMGIGEKDGKQVAIYVIVENAGFGATYGVPVGRLMIEKAIRGEISPENKGIEYNIMHTSLLPNYYYVWLWNQRKPKD